MQLVRVGPGVDCGAGSPVLELKSNGLSRSGGFTSTMKNPENLKPAQADQTVILIAEDEVLVANIVRIILEKHGYFILTASDGENALFISRQYPGPIHLLL